MGERVRGSRTNNPTLEWCVEFELMTIAEAVRKGINIAGLEDETVVILLHDTKRPDEPPKVYSRNKIAVLILGAKDGEFDHLVGPEIFAEVQAAQPA